MRPVNLIPPEQRRGERAPLRAGFVSYAIVGVLALALLGVVGMVMAGNSISEKESELASLEARQVVADQRAQELAPYGEFASLAESRRATVADLADSRFDWERVLRELALVIPGDVWLDSLTGTVAPGVTLEAEGAAETVTDPSITGPSLQISGCATGQVAVAGFVAALKDIDGVTRVGMQESSLGELGEAGVSDPAAATAGSEDGCQTREFIAAFQITVAFDAVPVSEYSPGASPESATPAPAATTTTTDDGGTSEAQSEQQAAEGSAAEQSAEAGDSAETVGVG